MKISDLLSWWMQNSGRARAVGPVLGAMQKGQARWKRCQVGALHAVALPVKEDLKPLNKQLAGLKRRLRDLDEKLEAFLSPNPIDS